jgi:Fe-S-cluster containining protein
MHLSKLKQSDIPQFSDNFIEHLCNVLIDPSVKEEDKKRFIDTVIQKHTALKEDLREDKKKNSVEAVTRAIYELIDNISEEEIIKSDLKVSCKKGCSACCHLNVGISQNEAKLLSTFLKKDQIAKLKRQRSVLDKLDKSTYDQFTKSTDWETSACVFLDDAGECSIYAYRPISCRKYFVVSDPDLCHVINNPGHKVASLISTDVEILCAAVVHYWHLKPMPIYLLKEIGE